MELNLSIGVMDHYTIIVPDADSSRLFHEKVLGFKFIKTQCLDTGTGIGGNPDMINHIMHLPNETNKSVVITQGLTENSIFNLYMKQYGSGIHHVAYRVNNLEKIFHKMRNNGIQFTSPSILRDPITGLKQVFIDKKNAGYFIELIERNEKIIKNKFTNNNMKKLANTMNQFIAK